MFSRDTLPPLVPFVLLGYIIPGHSRQPVDGLDTGTLGSVGVHCRVNLWGSSVNRPMALSFPSRAHHLAALYDACQLIVQSYRESDVFDVYEKEKLDDHVNFAATARELMGLIAEGEIK